jgi:heat-inducible transcriptional repressor
MGAELHNPALHDLALVGASYGLGSRPLGAISLVGPVRMNYGNAIRTVRAASRTLSRFVEDVYGDG